MNSDSLANNGNHSPKFWHTSLQTRCKKGDLIDKLLNDLCKVIEFKDLCSKLSYSPPIQNFVPLQPNFNIFQLDTALKNMQSPLNTNSKLPFGFRVYTCARCLESPIVPVLYPTKKEAMNEVTHECRPENIAALGHIHNKTKHMIRLRELSLRSLPMLIIESVVNLYNYLVAVALSNPPQEILLLPNPVNADVPISLLYSQEAQVELNLDRENKYNNDALVHHWAARAISQGVTKLEHKEITELIQLIGGVATFAFFKITMNGSCGYYFMMLGNYLHANDDNNSWLFVK